jgi:hypothetical protein
MTPTMNTITKLDVYILRFLSRLYQHPVYIYALCIVGAAAFLLFTFPLHPTHASVMGTRRAAFHGFGFCMRAFGICRITNCMQVFDFYCLDILGGEDSNH